MSSAAASRTKEIEDGLSPLLFVPLEIGQFAEVLRTFGSKLCIVTLEINILYSLTAEESAGLMVAILRQPKYLTISMMAWLPEVVPGAMRKKSGKLLLAESAGEYELNETYRN